MIRVYTREVIEGQYPNGLAYSVHMSIVDNGKEEPLHNNYGLLFAKADINSDNVICPNFVGTPKIVALSDAEGTTYLITGADLTATGETDKPNHYWCWNTKDFIEYDEWGLLPADQLVEKVGIPMEQIRATDTIELPEDMEEVIKFHWNPLRFKALEEYPDKDTVKVIYSDGSAHEKKLSTYPSLKFPLARGFGDPVVLLWKDEYYFIATNDNVNDIGLYVRKAHELDDLFAPDVQMHIILDKDEERHLIQTFWAPEFHIIGGDLYILFAVSGEQWGPQCHYMKLKKDGDILNPADWEDPVRIRKKDGSFLTEGAITLDMTYVKSGDRHYYAWSYREHIGSPLDSGSMIMIAEFDPKDPGRIITDPVCLSRPLYGFENLCGTINNEGPYAFYHDGTIYLSYSGADARGYLYVVGMLTAKDGDDLTDPAVWTKAKTPALSFASVPGEYGPGHNSFFCDRNGDWWIAFHGTTGFEERVISSGMRRIHFDRNNKPRFDLSREDDL